MGQQTPETVPLLDIDLDPHSYYGYYRIKERTGFSREQFADVWEEARTNYPDPTDYPYHWFAHGVDNFRRNMENGSSYEQQGIELNWPTLVVTPLEHDTKFHYETFGALGYNSKEQHSGLLGAIAARKLVLPRSVARKIYRACYVTRLFQHPQNAEEAIEVMGDIGNVAGDYETDFQPNNLRFMRERMLHEGSRFDRAVFEDFGIKVLSTYVLNVLRANVLDTSPFVRSAVTNLRRWSGEIALGRSIESREYLDGLTSEPSQFTEGIDKLLIPSEDFPERL